MTVPRGADAGRPSQHPECATRECPRCSFVNSPMAAFRSRPRDGMQARRPNEARIAPTSPTSASVLEDADASRRRANAGVRHPGRRAGRHPVSGSSSHLGQRSTSRCRSLVRESFLQDSSQVIGPERRSLPVVERPLGLSGSQPRTPPNVSAVTEGSFRTPQHAPRCRLDSSPIPRARHRRSGGSN